MAAPTIMAPIMFIMVLVIVVAPTQAMVIVVMPIEAMVAVVVVVEATIVAIANVVIIRPTLSIGQVVSCRTTQALTTAIAEIYRTRRARAGRLRPDAAGRTEKCTSYAKGEHASDDDARYFHDATPRTSDVTPMNTIGSSNV
jgi:hypothetical protein